MDLHSERLEAKLNAVDWAVRDVLVGTVRSPQQLDICRRHRFYYLPAEQLGDEAFSVRCVYETGVNYTINRAVVNRRFVT